MMNCNPETGACELPFVAHDSLPKAAEMAATVRYVGDPMCSWCWGLSPVLKQIAEHCSQEGIGFSVTMGGLRAGGGDPWNNAFKDFLRKEWNHIASVTGQPFGYGILEAPDFDYDTEPACRSIAIAQVLLKQHGERNPTALDFFTAVQRKFYVDGVDPKEVDFYKSVCAEVGIDFKEFSMLFNSPRGQQAVLNHFTQSREWNVRAFPTLILEVNGQFVPIASGYVKAQEAIARIKKSLTNLE